MVGHEVPHVKGYLKGAGGDKHLGVRLREMHRPDDIQHFTSSDVLRLSEAAWVIATQSELLDALGSEKQKSARSQFKFNPDYRYPTFERGYELAAKARRLLGISPDDQFAVSSELSSRHSVFLSFKIDSLSGSRVRLWQTAAIAESL